MGKLEDIQLRMILEQMAERGAKAFFSEHNLPPKLVEGWRRYQQKCVKRAEIGLPMPPGGTFVMGIESVWAGCMAEFHSGLSALVRVPVDKIKLRVERGKGGANVMADIELDDIPDLDLVGVDPVAAEAQKEKLFKLYLTQSVGIMNQVFRRNLRDRLTACESKRKDVVQEVVSGSQEESSAN